MKTSDYISILFAAWATPSVVLAQYPGQNPYWTGPWDQRYTSTSSVVVPPGPSALPQQQSPLPPGQSPLPPGQSPLPPGGSPTQDPGQAPPQTSVSGSNSSPPPGQNPPAPAVVSSVTPVGTSSSGSCPAGQTRLNFSGNMNFHWAMALGWGGTTGTGADASQCVPTVNSTGMHFGVNAIQGSPYPQNGYTYLECTLAAGQWNNCDMSLVVGFSLPVQCTIGDKTIGGTDNLFDLGATCPSPIVDAACANPYAQAYGASRSDVSTFFDNGYQANGTGGNNYCVYQFCDGDSDPQWGLSYPNPDINCIVGQPSAKQLAKRSEPLVLDGGEEMVKREAQGVADGLEELERREGDEKRVAERALEELERRDQRVRHRHAKAHARRELKERALG